MPYTEESQPTNKYSAVGSFLFVNPLTEVPATVSITIDVSAYDQFGVAVSGELADGMFQHFMNHLFTMPPIPGIEETSRNITGTKTNTRTQEVTPSE
jgi:hypothetical protein